MTSHSTISAPWLEEQLARALERLDRLDGEVERLQAALAAREHEAAELREALATIEGRTRRHESGQDVALELRTTVLSLEERLAAEAALRREQMAAEQRHGDRTRLSQEALATQISLLQARFTDMGTIEAAASEREPQLAAAFARRDETIIELAGRLEAFADKIEALSGGVRQAAGDASRLAEAVSSIAERLGAAEARGDVLQRDQQRIEGGLAALHRLAEREELLNDVQEQQRALRQRIEESVSGLSQRSAAFEAEHGADVEGQRLLHVQLATLRQQLETVATRVAGQGDVLVEHVRRITTATEDAGRRQMEEIDRQARAARELLVRLAEQADEATREQPL